MNILVWSTRVYAHAEIAYKASLWAFDTANWQAANVALLHQRTTELQRGDVVVLYCSEKNRQGIVMLGEVSGRPLPGTDITHLWPGLFQNPVPMRWWNAPHIVTKDQIKFELPQARRRGNTHNWQLYLGVPPLSLVRPNRSAAFKLNIHDLFFLCGRLPVDRTIESVSALLGWQAHVPPEIYPPFDHQAAPQAASLRPPGCSAGRSTGDNAKSVVFGGTNLC